MSDTPFTNSCTYGFTDEDGIHCESVHADVARTLERARDRYKSDVELITKERDEARKQLRVAVGLLSTTPKFQNQHPEEVLTFVEEAAK